MSDSDSDDDLLLSGPVFRKTARQERAADMTREKGLAYLDSSLQEEKKREALNDNIAKIKQENWDCNDEERLTQAETIAKESQKNKRKATYNDVDGNINIGGLAALALRDQLTTAVDTAQASTLGTRAVLGRGNDKDVWSTVEFCLEELDGILKRLQSQKGKKDDKAFRAALVSLLKTANQNGTLEEALFYRKLAKLCKQHNRMHLPKELTEWLLCLAFNPIDEQSDSLSVGAFQTLLTIFTRARGVPGKPLLTMNDMIRDMETCFALQVNEAAHPSPLDEKENQESTVDIATSISPVSVSGLQHFLLLWERAFLNNIVALDESPEEAATQCMVALSRAALDPCFYKCEG